MFFLFLLIFIACSIASLIFLVQLIRKKPDALKKFGIAAVICFVSFIGAIFTADVDEVETASTIETSEESTEVEPDEETEAESEGIYEINETYEVNGLTIDISTIEVSDDDVKIAMKLTNNSETTLSFYPDQGDIIIGNKQVGANMFMTDGDVSGDIHAGVEKSGTIRFILDDDISTDDIEEITLKLGDVYNEDEFNAEEFSETLSLK